MLPSSHRLPLRQLPTFFETANRLHNRFFTAFYSFSGELVQAVVIVPKKQLSLATDRNKLKRRTAAAVAELLPELTTQHPGLNVALSMKRSAQNVSTEQLVHQLRAALKKVSPQ